MEKIRDILRQLKENHKRLFSEIPSRDIILVEIGEITRNFETSREMSTNLLRNSWLLKLKRVTNAYVFTHHTRNEYTDEGCIS